MSFGQGSSVLPFPGRGVGQVGFARDELSRILDLYGRMVAEGEWRDYAMDFTRDFAAFDPAMRALYTRFHSVAAARTRLAAALGV